MDIENTLILASKSYSEDIAQRALINLIPWAGSSMDNIFTSKWSNYQQNRLEIFQNCVKEQFQQIDEEKVDFAFIESEEFFDLIISLIEKSVKTRHKEKIELFSKLLRCQVDMDFISNYQPEDFTQIINDFTPREILILNAIEKLNKDFQIEKEKSNVPVEIYINVVKLKNYVHFSDDEINFSLSKLSKLGLLNEYYPNQFGMISGGEYQVTDTYQEILKIIEH